MNLISVKPYDICTMASGEPGRTKAYDNELRWRIVYPRYAMDLNYREIANNVNVDTSTVCRVVQRFEATGSVSSDNHRSREEPDSAGIPCP